MTVVDPSAETAAQPVAGKAGAGGIPPEKVAPVDETLEQAGGTPPAPVLAASSSPYASGDSLEAGALLGKYRLERIVGAGGMGVVWAAVDPDLDRTVAIKVLRVAGDDPLLRSRLLREARAMARLKHGNVLTVYEVGTHKNRDYIAMELIEGSSLDVWLAARPPRPEIITAMLAAGRGLAAAHAAGIVHRDFKPHNVLRDGDGRVLVTDFGLARGQIEAPDEIPVELLDRASFAPAGGAGPGASAGLGSERRPRRLLDSVLDSPLTQTGVLIGTPAYMAPEQFLGAAPDPRTDQFAFCVAMWEALTGTRPFRGGSLDELQQAARLGVATVPADLPRSVRAVLQRGLEPDPSRRWPDMPSLLAALGRALTPPSRRGLWVGAIAGLGGVALIAGIAMIVTSPRTSPARAAQEARPPQTASEARVRSSSEPSIKRSGRRTISTDGTTIELGDGSDGNRLIIPIPRLDLPFFDAAELLDLVPPVPPVPPMPPVPPTSPAAPYAPQPPARPRDHSEALAAEAEAAAEAAEVAVERAAEARSTRAAALAAGACEPGDQVFASAWSPGRRKQLAFSKEALQKNPSLIGATALLDRLRAEWLRSYDRICAHPEDPAFAERRACLLELRDEVRNATATLGASAGQALDEADLTSLALAAAASALCVGGGDFGEE